MSGGAEYDDETGWCALMDLLSPDELATIADACDQLLALPESARYSRDKPTAGTRHLVALHDRIPLVAEIVNRLDATVQTILAGPGEPFEVGFRSPQPGYGDQQLHADDVPKFDHGPNRVATAIIALVDFTETNGSTRIVPASHRRADLQREAGSLGEHPDQLRLTGDAGTAFVFSGHLLHSGTRNDSDADRPALQIVWRATS